VKTRRIAGLLCALILACISPPTVFALNGQVVYVEGDVTVQNGSQARDAAIGDSVGPGDTVKTGPASLAVIDVGNATTLKLREKTTLALDSIGEQTAVTLTAGGVFTSITRKLSGNFSVRTSSAVAGVRGTQFFVAYGRTIDRLPDVWLCVNQGTVEVALPESGAAVLVKEGLGINIVGGAKLTTPRRYPWTRRLNWNMDPAGGTVIDRTDLEQAYSDLLNQDYD
jgi:ferric-dicitrate binding protein FerR (iron transport regulator)